MLPGRVKSVSQALRQGAARAPARKRPGDCHRLNSKANWAGLFCQPGSCSVQLGNPVPTPQPKPCCLTRRSTGHVAACRHLARHFILVQMPSRLNVPVSSNVRQRQCKPRHRQLASPNSLSRPRWACQIQTTLSAIHSVFRLRDKLARLSSVVGATSPTCALLAN